MKRKPSDGQVACLPGRRTDGCKQNGPGTRQALFPFATDDYFFFDL
jgi:hypothetical protein